MTPRLIIICIVLLDLGVLGCIVMFLVFKNRIERLDTAVVVMATMMHERITKLEVKL